MDCSWNDAYLLAGNAASARLPAEVIQILQHGSNSQYLNALAELALDPKWTIAVFSTHEPLFVDLCSRWLSDSDSQATSLKAAAALARILPIAPYLCTYAEELICRRRIGIFSILPSHTASGLLELRGPVLHELLVTLVRLLVFDNHTFAAVVFPAQIQLLLNHSLLSVRWLAIRILCSYLHAADKAFSEMVKRYVGNAEVLGDWEDKTIDFTFFSLWEQQRLKDASKVLQDCRAARQDGSQSHIPGRTITADAFSDLTAYIAGVLVPRLGVKAIRPSSLVLTANTSNNIRLVAEAIREPLPLLLIGLSGTGKTTIIRDIARELSKDTTMLTLHLNEQTDAKLLIGMYTSANKPGTFSWQPGVLTTAVKEGRWVMIEDLDRAPNEVISTLLPLLERGELFIPNLGESIRASQGFKLIATIRTNLNTAGREVTPGLNMLGIRHWNQVSLRMPLTEDMRQIVTNRFPILHGYMPKILAVYDTLRNLDSSAYVQPKFASKVGRPIGPQDLLRWCTRLESLLSSAGVKSGNEAIPEAVNDSVFLEAVDCFAGGSQSVEISAEVTLLIARELHIPAERARYCTKARIPEYTNNDTRLCIGRAALIKSQGHQGAKSLANRSGRRPFARTNHALRTLESVGVAVVMAEPCLLVGETGTGKTTIVQELADCTGHKLVVVNLSQQSEVGDLLGGYKPVNMRALAVPMKDEFDDLFKNTFSSKRNHRYLEALGRATAKGQWSRCLKLWREALGMVDDTFGSSTPNPTRSTEQHVPKRRKLESTKFLTHKSRWDKFSRDVENFQVHLESGPKGFAFSYVEGNIVNAARNGDWVLLDEINLASPDTLESLADLLSHGASEEPSLLLSETGDLERIYAHKGFRIFGAMNPATDIGKRDLSISLRSRFTEYFVEAPDKDEENLRQVVNVYLGSHSHTDTLAASDIAKLYLEIKQLVQENRLVDGADQKPHFSLRTLTRTLTYVTDIAPIYGLRRALFEGFSMSFLTVLNRESELLVLPLIDRYLLSSQKNRRAFLNQIPRSPRDSNRYIQFRHYWVAQGSFPIQERPQYIITPFVERNLLNLVRATSTRRFPVLLQGPTSSGKTSMIEYLASVSGNRFVRVNNHEHTDLQEYLGTYVSGPNGQLQYQEGILVHALREGYWIVLDELNLAPTDVLEALNRLLDDNRELFIPETQEVVRPHKDFMLFATQNPPGLYGGRKALSRAFRNRFLELHFDDIPEDELETILRERSQIAPSFCAKIVAVYKKLSLLRQSGRLFEQKHSFATLRDLFRWALRDADDREQLAINGFMLLAERVRNLDERLAVKQVIEDTMKVKIDENHIYGTVKPEAPETQSSTSSINGIVWTKSMRRLYTLVVQALKNNEPVLLVGETGCGKTSMCQVIAEVMRTQLHVVNAHQNTETGDLIGAQRPMRNRTEVEGQLMQDLTTLLAGSAAYTSSHKSDLQMLLEAYNALEVGDFSNIPTELRERVEMNIAKINILFEWSDGSLVHAMKAGHHFLLDEISLADDSVLERLNSVLEPGRTLLLAEKGPNDSLVAASEGFQFLATMNPGGDYGKKELSPALRNRFTEIWVPPFSDKGDIFEIIQAKLVPSLVNFARPMVNFASWYHLTFNASVSSISVREVLAWVYFVNVIPSPDPYFSLLHGAAMVYIDGLGANPAAKFIVGEHLVGRERRICLQKLDEFFQYDLSSIYDQSLPLLIYDHRLEIGPFGLERIQTATAAVAFSLQAPTTMANAMRVVRALQLRKPILLEGSPGVGKTTLVAALAQAIGMPLTRINLSEQTDIMDLFGSDVPVEDGGVGHFAWRDAPFLQAMQRGQWVLLDEMNLASQSVLEGLNACLDHRGQVYVPELDQTFSRHPNFAVFAAQNPHHQGGGRKGLPASFINRFTIVHADVLTSEDLLIICKQLYPNFAGETIDKLIQYVATLSIVTQQERSTSANGGPWEFNLRDILRWLHLLTSPNLLMPAGTPADFQHLLFLQRLRDREAAAVLSTKLLPLLPSAKMPRSYFHNLSQSSYQVGLGMVTRNSIFQPVQQLNGTEFKVDIPILESVMLCVQHSWPCLLVGPSGSGKTNTVRHLASIAGADLIEFPMNSDMDTMDLVGGYEQIDVRRRAVSFTSKLHRVLRGKILPHLLILPVPEPASRLLQGTDNAQISDLPYLYESLLKLTDSFPFSELSALIEECSYLLELMEFDNRARFEWLDGVLVQALQDGKWLVLDNANLCSSSVLDRLNSLLEPNGYLSINEHRSPDGSARMIKPHPNFRLFLTTDPRHGELSRAMRNRCIELFLFPPDSSTRKIAWSISSESSLCRFQSFQHVDWNNLDGASARELATICLDHLAISDFAICRRWYMQVEMGLTSMLPPWREHFSSILKTFLQLLEAKGSIATTIEQLYRISSTAASFPEDFHDVQTIHPLNNAPLLPILSRDDSFASPTTLAGLLETLAQLYNLGARLTILNDSLEQRSASSLSRLERSMASGRTLAFSKDSTQPLANFLNNFRIFLCQYIEHRALYQSVDMTISVAVKELTTYIHDVFDFALSKPFDEGVFQVYLTIGRSMIVRANAIEGVQDLYSALAMQLNLFNLSWKLSTGRSMEALWNTFRPPTVREMRHLRLILQIEELADSFDDLAWRSKAPFEDLVDLRRSIAFAFWRVETTDVQTSNGLEDIKTALDSLESKLRVHPTNVVPYFQEEFEGLYQHFTSTACKRPMAIPPILSLLAGHATKALMQLDEPSYASSLLAQIEPLTGIGAPYMALTTIRNVLPVSLLTKTINIFDVPLRSLDMLSREIQVISKSSAHMCESMLWNPCRLLNNILSSLHAEVCKAHEAFLDRQSMEAYFVYLEQFRSDFHFHLTPPPGLSLITSGTSADADHIRSALEDHLAPSLLQMYEATKDGGDQIASTASAWINFFTGCLILFVPDRPFDPSLRPRIEKDRYNKREFALQNQLRSFQRFEEMFTGQLTNLRCGLAEEEIRALGHQPQVPTIARPRISELGQLQGELNNVLTSVVRRSPDVSMLRSLLDGNSAMVRDVQLIRQNISQAVSRLSNNFRAYDDITKPIIRFLQGLDVGLALALIAVNKDEAIENDINLICRTTPFLGLQSGQLNSTRLNNVKVYTMKNIEQRERYLNAAALTKSVGNQLDPETRNTVFEIFHSFYEQWKERLSSDQDKYTAKSSLYRYRGGQEEVDASDNQEFFELFPSYDAVSASSKAERQSAIGAPPIMAQKLAGCHRAIFTGSQDSSAQVLNMLDEAAGDIVSLWKDTSYSLRFPVQAAQMLPCVIVALHSSSERLLGVSGIDKMYNFYVDGNITEAQKLVGLVKRIQDRFRNLKDAWPEHATLEDVLRASNELLDFAHREPIVKYLTKAEQVHGYIHEWQVVASREYSVSTLYDELTALLVTWRRLELSTWSRLLDLEDQKCSNDAMSWWFIAYEVIVAVPLSTASSGEDILEHVEHLFATLEDFLATTLMGQYSQRLRLIEQFKKHAKLLSHDMPSMTVVHTALANFLSYYTRYEPIISETLRKGRQVLEKDMKEILLLASWKDTNINALRDSAKRSHHKLFKVIRKYRSQLGQPAENVIRHGLPEEASAPTSINSTNAVSTEALVDQHSLRICQEKLRGWAEKPARFTNPSMTVTNMARMSQLPDFLVDGPLYIDSFCTNLMDTIKVLQKETPSVLTDENKSTVKHLKSRKRKLFADTLKDMRQMGFKSNLGADALGKQASLPTVLTNTPVVQCSGFEGSSHLRTAEYHFHKVLDNMTILRRSSRQHPEDLSSGEVARSLGYLEGILSVMLKQRSTLASNIADLESLEGSVKTMRNLWAPGNYSIHTSNQQDQSQDESVQQTLRWLPTIIDVGCNIIEKQNKMGDLDSSAAIDGLRAWKATIQAIVDEMGHLPSLPEGITASSIKEIQRQGHESLKQLSADLLKYKHDYPAVSFVFYQIGLWTEPVQKPPIGHMNGGPLIEVSQLDHAVSKTLDTVLVAIQRMQEVFSFVPSSTEDTAWLVHVGNLLSDTVRFLHNAHVSKALEDIMLKLHGVGSGEEENLTTAAAMCAMALPIIWQYQSISQAAVNRCAQLHSAICKMGYILSSSFKQIVSKGFCDPVEKSDIQEGKTEKLEGGTGLGEGEGAEDISKDIQDDEDLSELAQEGQKSKDQEHIENEEDAVDMQHDDLDGETGSVSDKGEDESTDNSQSDIDANEIDEEAGDVNDLDPSTVDEKLWDGNNEETEKDKGGDQSKGKKQKDEQTAAQEGSKRDSDSDEAGDQEDGDETGIEEGEEVAREEIEKTDPHLQDGQNLQLPDEMELDGDKTSVADLESDDDDIDVSSDLDQDEQNEEEAGLASDDDETAEVREENGTELDVQQAMGEESDEDAGKTEDAGSPVDTEGEEDQQGDDLGLLQDRTDDGAVDADNVAPSDAHGIGDDNAQQDNVDEKQSNGASNDKGTKGKSLDNEMAQAQMDDRERGHTAAQPGATEDQDDNVQDSNEGQAFKKLGDALEKWHRQNQRIRDASNTDDDKDNRQDPADGGAVDDEFEHLPDAETAADTQALGAASEDQAHALDKRALDSEMHDLPRDFLPDNIVDEGTEEDDGIMEDVNPTPESLAGAAERPRPGVVIGENTVGKHEARQTKSMNIEREEDIEDIDNDLSIVHLEAGHEEGPRSAEEARRLWNHYENLTRDLSLFLTEQLRLILAPTLATKMRGDFRTGKRLNIKRIIPYIASQYKRDKIWMRRSVPSKRNYQIMLAVDDSKSMGENGSGQLAFETLALISKSLSMLEVGEICIVGFGDDVRVAHEFDKPFSSEAGMHAFQQFGFQQTNTNVRKLIAESIKLFREARNKTFNAGTDLWQLELIISDGVCEDHETIRRLVRQAHEESIMIVFVIVDALKGESIMDMTQARFEPDTTGETKLKITRYLDGFPFGYYLIVGHVRELPSVLATALRQWFAEVADSD